MSFSPSLNINFSRCLPALKNLCCCFCTNEHDDHLTESGVQRRVTAAVKEAFDEHDRTYHGKSWVKNNVTVLDVSEDSD